jgi:uncharacterized delta-60 repeat protein
MQRQSKAAGAWKRHSRSVYTGCIAAALILVVAASPALGKPGDLDLSFGSHGRVTTAADLSTPWSGKDQVGIAKAPGGALVMASERTLARYLPDGRLDPEFGDGGMVKIAAPDGLRFSLGDIAIDGHGRTVLFGGAVNNNAPLQPVFPAYPAGLLFPSFAAILRYQRDGKLDPTFGDGGVVLTDFGLPPSPPYQTPVVVGTVGTVDSQDRPTLIGGVEEIIGTCGHSAFGRLDRLIARLKPGGELDPTFGRGDGISFLPDTRERVSDIALDRGGDLILAATPGEESCDGAPDLTLIRMHANGVLDPTFGTAGMHRYPERGSPGDLVVDRFKRILVMGDRLLRLTASGNLDRSFGQAGEVALDFPGNGQSGAGLAAIDSHDRPLLVGTFAERPSKRVRTSLMVSRLLTSGKLDRSFGRGGLIVTPFGRRSNVSGRDALIDRKGRLVVAGVVTRPSLEPTAGFALARYLLKP